MSSEINMKLIQMVEKNREDIDENLSHMDIKLEKEFKALENIEEKSRKRTEDLESVKVYSKDFKERFSYLSCDLKTNF